MKTILTVLNVAVTVGGAAMAQDLDAIDRAVAEIAAHYGDYPTGNAEARTELGRLLAEDPDGAAAIMWFDGLYESQTGQISGMLTLRPDGYLRVLEADPLPAIDQAWLAGSAVLAMFGSDLYRPGGGCVRAAFFRLIDNPPRSPLETQMAAAMPLLVEAMALTERTTSDARARVLAGEPVDPDGTAMLENTRSAVLSAAMMQGLDYVRAEAEWLHMDPLTGEATPVEVVLGIVDGLSEADLSMIIAAQPFGETVMGLWDVGQEEAFAAFCNR